MIIPQDKFSKISNIEQGIANVEGADDPLGHLLAFWDEFISVYEKKEIIGKSRLDGSD